jgi:preprotein translocase subunit SecD
MAILLFEKGKGEVLTAPVIRRAGQPVPDLRRMSVGGSQRPGAAAARRLAGRADGNHRGTHHRPEPGRREHRQGLPQRAWGFRGDLAFMASTTCCSACSPSLALAVNLLLLVAILSMLQATLTLPGMAAMALALGMAIDSNVLINERVREELRNGASPQAAIHAGYDRAWATILDSNVTT